MIGLCTSLPTQLQGVPFTGDICKAFEAMQLELQTSRAGLEAMRVSAAPPDTSSLSAFFKGVEVTAAKYKGIEKAANDMIRRQKQAPRVTAAAAPAAGLWGGNEHIETRETPTPSVHQPKIILNSTGKHRIDFMQTSLGGCAIRCLTFLVRVDLPCRCDNRVSPVDYQQVAFEGVQCNHGLGGMFC